MKKRILAEGALVKTRDLYLVSLLHFAFFLKEIFPSSANLDKASMPRLYYHLTFRKFYYF